MVLMMFAICPVQVIHFSLRQNAIKPIAADDQLGIMDNIANASDADGTCGHQQYQ